MVSLWDSMTVPCIIYLYMYSHVSTKNLSMHVAFTTTCMLFLILEKNTPLINQAASVFGLVICHVF